MPNAEVKLNDGLEIYDVVDSRPPRLREQIPLKDRYKTMDIFILRFRRRRDKMRHTFLVNTEGGDRLVHVHPCRMVFRVDRPFRKRWTAEKPTMMMKTTVTMRIWLPENDRDDVPLLTMKRQRTGARKRRRKKMTTKRARKKPATTSRTLSYRTTKASRRR